jgi:hypothetical protein
MANETRRNRKLQRLNPGLAEEALGGPEGQEPKKHAEDIGAEGGD